MRKIPHRLLTNVGFRGSHNSTAYQAIVKVRGKRTANTFISQWLQCCSCAHTSRCTHSRFTTNSSRVSLQLIHPFVRIGLRGHAPIRSKCFSCYITVVVGGACAIDPKAYDKRGRKRWQSWRWNLERSRVPHDSRSGVVTSRTAAI